MDQHTPLQSRKSMLSFIRTDSVRLHGFQQKRAVRRGSLRTVESTYLQAAADGNVPLVEKLFKKYTSEQLNGNCTDIFERSALVLAILNHHEDMVRLLLKNQTELTESLFYAIEMEFTEAVEEILRSDVAQATQHKEMLITSEESVFPRFLSPMMLAAHKNNYEILEILYSNGHRLRDFSRNASNKWDQIRLRWLYYKARASHAYIILMYNKEKVDPLNEAIEFFGQLKNEGLKSREVRENYKELAKQCEEFAIALLDQVRTAHELADILRFRLVDRKHENTNQLALNTLPVLLTPGSVRRNVNTESDERGMSPLDRTPEIKVIKAQNSSSIPHASNVLSPRPSTIVEDNTAELIRHITNTDGTSRCSPSPEPTRRNIKLNHTPGEIQQLKACSLDSDSRRLSSVIDSIPEERVRTLGIRRSEYEAVAPEHARPIHFLKPIEKAVDHGMIRLVTCENSQLALAYLKDGILFRNESPCKVLLLKFLIGIMFPVISIAFYLLPNSRIGLIARNPTAKLWMEVSSDICLIILLLTNLFLHQFQIHGPSVFSPLLIIAYMWMPGKLLNLIFLAYHQGSRIFYSIWNWNDIGSILFYTVFICLRTYAVLNEENVEGKGQWSAVPLSDIMICLVYILVFLRPLEILRVNRTFGPLQVSVDRMLKDVSKFFLLFLVIWFAFSSGLNTLYWRYGSQHSNTSCNSTEIMHVICCSEEGKFTDLASSLQVHFWSLFGYSDNYAVWFDLMCTENADRTATAIFGEVIFALYHVGTVLVLVNMLIAIMSGTLQKTIDDSDIQWQFHRTRVWIRFIRTGFYRPPPMNILPRPKELVFAGKVVVKYVKMAWRYITSCGSIQRGSPRNTYEPEFQLSEMQNKSTKSLTEFGSQSSLNGSSHHIHNYNADLGYRYKSPSHDETTSLYDITLKKCVKRYVKTHVLQTHQYGV